MATMDITESGFQTPASKKRKASGSPSLPPASQPTTPPTSYKNRTPLIATGIDPKFKTQIQIMSELRQYHPSLRVFQIRQSSKGWLFIGDTPKDFAILQSETKMKQVFGPKVKVSLPKSYHSADASKTKILIFKGVSHNITIKDFQELLDFNKISHAEAERMKSKRTGKDLPFIKIKSDKPKQAEALLSGGLVCQKTGIIFRVEEFKTTPSILQCFKCQSFGHKALNCTKKEKCVVCGEAHSHKNCPNKEKRKPKCANCRGPHVANYTGCPAYKDQAFRQHVVQKQISYASVLKQASPPPTSNTFSFTAEQIVSLVTNVVIQIAQPQLCTKNLPEKQVQAKSDLSKQIAETAKKCLGVNIEGKDVFESIISRPAPPPPAPFVFSSTLVEKKKAPLLKASTVSNKVTPPLVTPSSNSTKSTKAPSLGPQRKSSSKLSPPHKTSTKPSPNKPST